MRHPVGATGNQDDLMMFIRIAAEEDEAERPLWSFQSASIRLGEIEGACVEIGLLVDVGRIDSDVAEVEPGTPGFHKHSL